MIKILDNDTIVDIIQKMKKETKNEIILEFPFGHLVLHNFLSLKILKSQLGTKKLVILTTDIVARKIGKPLGIEYSIIKDRDFFEEKSIKSSMMKKNFGMFEYMIFETKKYSRKIANFFLKKAGLHELKYKSPYSATKASGVFLLIFGLLVSIALLVFIFYFAVSKTYIYISPEIIVKSKAKNIIYKELQSDNMTIDSNIVEVKKIGLSLNLTEIYRSTQIDLATAKRAKGNVVFINELKTEQILRPKTRLVSKQGITYETKDWVRIPGGSQKEPAKVVAQIEARVVDNEGRIVGVKGNISKNTTFTLPGLKFNRDKIYAINESPISGGTNEYNYIIASEDIKNSSAVLEEKIKKKLLENIKEKIKNDNNTNNTNYEILSVDNAINYKNIAISRLAGVKAGDKIDKFTLQASANIEAYIYNKKQVTTQLNNLINETLLSGTEKLMNIDAKSIRISNIISRKDNPLTIKATTETQYSVAYDFDNNSNVYVQKIKNTILGSDITEATNLLLNDNKIANIKIVTSPFFIKKVSNIPENIILKVVEK